MIWPTQGIFQKNMIWRRASVNASLSPKTNSIIPTAIICVFLGILNCKEEKVGGSSPFVGLRGAVCVAASGVKSIELFPVSNGKDLRYPLSDHHLDHCSLICCSSQ